jgi:DNA-binding transcriptional ArsR family regulator
MITTPDTTPQVNVNDSEALQIAELFSALSDPSRVKIVAALLNGPMNVQSLAAVVGITESGISHHMRNLRQMRLVRPRKEGRQVFYSLEDQHVADLLCRVLEHIQHG